MRSPARSVPSWCSSSRCSRRSSSRSDRSRRRMPRPAARSAARSTPASSSRRTSRSGSRRGLALPGQEAVARGVLAPAPHRDLLAPVHRPPPDLRRQQVRPHERPRDRELWAHRHQERPHAPRRCHHQSGQGGWTDPAGGARIVAANTAEQSFTVNANSKGQFAVGGLPQGATPSSPTTGRRSGSGRACGSRR